MAIYIRPADTRPGPILMGQILPFLINYRVGYGFFLKKKKKKKKKKKTQSGSGSGSGFMHTRPELDPNTHNIKKKKVQNPSSINTLFSFQI